MESAVTRPSLDHETTDFKHLPLVLTTREAANALRKEFERLVSASASEPDWHAAVLVAGEAGLRLGEVLALEWADIDLKIGVLTVMRTDWRGHVGAPKGGKARRIPLTLRTRRRRSRTWPDIRASPSRTDISTWPPESCEARSRFSKLGDRWATNPKT
jgi:integrase